MYVLHIILQADKTLKIQWEYKIFFYTIYFIRNVLTVNSDCSKSQCAVHYSSRQNNQACNIGLNEVCKIFIFGPYKTAVNDKLWGFFEIRVESKQIKNSDLACSYWNLYKQNWINYFPMNLDAGAVRFLRLFHINNLLAYTILILR